MMSEDADHSLEYEEKNKPRSKVKDLEAILGRGEILTQLKKSLMDKQLDSETLSNIYPLLLNNLSNEISLLRNNLYASIPSKQPNDDEYYMDEISPEVRNFVKKQNAPQDQFNNLNLTLERIKEFLNKQNVEYKIVSGLYTDPEYPEWQEIELKIKIKKDLDFIYENFKPKIYEVVRFTLPEILLDKVLVDLESF